MTAMRLTASMVALVATAAGAGAQEVGFQPTDGANVMPLSAEMAERLDDPFFRNVLQINPAAFQLTTIEQLIQPEAGKRKTFVVSEEIHKSSGPVSARSVIAFDGAAPNGDPLQGNVFISTPLRSADPGLPELTDFEVMAWDGTNGTYNYYKLDEGPGHGGRSWRFRGSSERADVMANEEREGTCFACHTNGAPVMKELLFPWNNWHAISNRVAGLVASADDQRWTAARRAGGDLRLTAGLGGGEGLEGLVTDAIVRFNGRRVGQALGEPDGEGRVGVADAPRLLRPLFETTEVNLISAPQQSGLNVTGGPDHRTGRPGAAVKIPNSSLVNSNLIANGFKVAGLGVTEAGSFAAVPELAIKPEEYAELGAQVGPARGWRSWRRRVRLVRARGGLHRQQHGGPADRGRHRLEAVRRGRARGRRGAADLLDRPRVAPPLRARELHVRADPTCPPRPAHPGRGRESGGGGAGRRHAGGRVPGLAARREPGRAPA